jgi:hypothetical protein
MVYGRSRKRRRQRSSPGKSEIKRPGAESWADIPVCLSPTRASGDRQECLSHSRRGNYATAVKAGSEFVSSEMGSASEGVGALAGAGGTGTSATEGAGGVHVTPTLA